MIQQRTLLALSLSAIAMSSHAGSYGDTTLNNSFAAAADINPYFTTGFSADIGDMNGNNTSLSAPWVTIAGQGNGANDYFSFDVSKENQAVNLDIDYTMEHPDNPNGFDSYVALWQQTGPNTYTPLNWVDDSPISAGADGSVHVNDSFLEEAVPPGHYIAGVSMYPNSPTDAGWGPGWPPIPNDDKYTLQVQVTAVPEPETYAMLLAGLGLVGFIARRRNRDTGSW